MTRGRSTLLLLLVALGLGAYIYFVEMEREHRAFVAKTVVERKGVLPEFQN